MDDQSDSEETSDCDSQECDNVLEYFDNSLKYEIIQSDNQSNHEEESQESASEGDSDIEDKADGFPAEEKKPGIECALLGIQSDETGSSGDSHTKDGCFPKNKSSNNNHGDPDKGYSFDKLKPKKVKLKVVYKKLVDCYDIRKYKKRGKIAIFNVVNFLPGPNGKGYPDREGSDSDTNNLCSLFTDLGFEVERHRNPTKQTIIDGLKELTECNFSKIGCCACFFLTHGEKEAIHATDEKVLLADIFKPFRTQNLAGKPKLFFFQACRGRTYMSDLTTDSPGTEDLNEDDFNLNLPVEADFLYAYSTAFNYMSWRHTLEGSWFINDLIAVFRAHAHEYDINHMLTIVNQKLSKRILVVPDNPEAHKIRQIGSFVNQLRYQFAFYPPGGSISKTASDEM